MLKLIHDAARVAFGVFRGFRLLSLGGSRIQALG